MKLTLMMGLLLCLVSVSVQAATINTQISPFTDSGAATVKSGLAPQITPVLGPQSISAIQFGVDTLNVSTDRRDVGATLASIDRLWPDFTNLSAAARVTNGNLGVRASALGTNFVGIDLQAHANASFRDALTVTLSSLPLGSTGFLNLNVAVDGAFNCAPRTVCNTGLVFGYAPGTLGYNQSVHFIGGEQPAVGSFSTSQSLVPLPFVSGQSFNIVLGLVTTARINETTGFNTSDLFNSLAVTGISASDADGAPLAFSITSASGLRYNSSGIDAAQAVPEPGTFALSLCSFALVAACATLRRRK